MNKGDSAPFFLILRSADPIVISLVNDKFKEFKRLLYYTGFESLIAKLGYPVEKGGEWFPG